MQDIQIYYQDKEKKVSDVLYGFIEGEEERVKNLMGCLVERKSTADFENLLGEIQAVDYEETNRLGKTVINFAKERGKLLTSLNRLLIRVDSLKIKHFKKTLKGLKQEQANYQANEWIDKLASEQKRLREEASDILNSFKDLQAKIAEPCQ